MKKIAYCTCKTIKRTAPQNFSAKGKVHIFILLGLRDFTAGISKEDFEIVRGSKAFANYVKNISPLTDEYFFEDDNENKVITRGHEFQVFRGHLCDDWLNKTFQLKKNETTKPSDKLLADDWAKYDFRIRLSRAGFLEIRLTRDLPKEGEEIIQTLQSLMEFAARGNTTYHTPSRQLKLAIHCANWFIQSISKQIQIKDKDEEETLFSLIPFNETTTEKLYRQRYATLFLTEILCETCQGRIEADKLKKEYNQTLAAVLEGVLIENDKSQPSFPKIDTESIEIIDLASWNDDLFIFAPERSLIYFAEKNIYLSGQTDAGRAVSYESYWECIIRGIEHTLAVRSALQIIESNTTKSLDRVPSLTQKVIDGDISNSDKKEITKMAQGVANTFNLLPMLRNILVPSSSYRASYAVNKFEHLNLVLHIKEMEKHAERNVDELVSFVQFYSDMQVQQELSKNQDAIDRSGLIIALVAFAITIPSFFKDYFDFATDSDSTTLLAFIKYLFYTEITFIPIVSIFIIGSILVILLIRNFFGKQIIKRISRFQESFHKNRN